MDLLITFLLIIICSLIIMVIGFIAIEFTKHRSIISSELLGVFTGLLISTLEFIGSANLVLVIAPEITFNVTTMIIIVPIFGLTITQYLVRGFIPTRNFIISTTVCTLILGLIILPVLQLFLTNPLVTQMDNVIDYSKLVAQIIKINLASAIAFFIDFILVIIVFQWIYNRYYSLISLKTFRHNTGVMIAIVIGLMITTALDSVIFLGVYSLITFTPLPNLVYILSRSLGNSISSIWVGVSVFIYYQISAKTGPNELQQKPAITIIRDFFNFLDEVKGLQMSYEEIYDVMSHQAANDCQKVMSGLEIMLLDGTLPDDIKEVLITINDAIKQLGERIERTREIYPPHYRSSVSFEKVRSKILSELKSSNKDDRKKNKSEKD